MVVAICSPVWNNGDISFRSDWGDSTRPCWSTGSAFSVLSDELSIMKTIAKAVGKIISYSGKYYSQNGELISRQPFNGKGDVDGDGMVTARDMELVTKYTVGLVTLTPTQLLKADINGDGIVNIVDALSLEQYLLGKVGIGTEKKSEEKSDNTGLLLVGVGILALILMGGKK